MDDEPIRRAQEILRTLRGIFSIPEFSSVERDPFRVLIRTVISQSTNDINAARAYENLSRELSITPDGLADADLTVIEASLKVAGLYKNKSIVLKNISRLILEKFNGSLDFIRYLPLCEARERLMSLPGVGPKTADIVLLFSGGRPTLPIDTHVNRVSKRLSLASSNANYESIRAALQALYHSDEYFEVHMLFIALGRRYCKAIRPLHSSCPLNKLCLSARF